MPLSGLSQQRQAETDQLAGDPNPTPTPPLGCPALGASIKSCLTLYQ